MFKTWPIRVKLLVGLGLLVLVVAILSSSGLYTTYAYRSLVKSLSARVVELPVAAELAENVGTSQPMRPKPMTQDQLLGLFSADTVGRNVVLEPATQFDMCGRTESKRETLEVVYDAA